MGGAAPARRRSRARRQTVAINGIIPLTAVAADGAPLGGTCMTVAGAGAARRRRSPCDSCHFVDETMGFLREETKKRGFPTIDGVHMGPCEIHRKHAHTIGPDGALYACPGFTGEPTLRHRPHRRRPDAAPGEGGRHASIASAPGASAATARSSPCAPAAAASPRTPNSVTWTRRPVTATASNRRSCRYAAEAAAALVSSSPVTREHRS